ncbi:hypothetical protein E8E13_005132 [Curvularia kusanoi]|uniref:F-box domain-containing protein n=1 Tax=Curvularia kusanoi TaxID=90978 RepID=A0A9P4T625_CURKU|nr:hypothetical protein E8E13_005132 [Curvularia kusanoi]
MASKKRSSKKRTRDHADSSKSAVTSLNQQRKKAKKSKRAPVEVPALRCQLLELPPEIRNRIYYFCEEDSRYADHQYPLRKTTDPEEVPEYLRTRTFFSLTQACKQIRIEYRPLWLRQSFVLVDYSDLKDFLCVFYHYGTHGLLHKWCRDAPRRLTISWDHDLDMNEDGDNVSLIDIKPLVKLRAHSPTSIITFECRRLLENDLPDLECEECHESITLPNPHLDELDPETDPAEAIRYGWCCQHEDTIMDALGEIHMDYEYLEPLNEFLNNNNVTWLKSIEDIDIQSISIDCTMGEDCGLPTIYIRFPGPYEVPMLLETKNTHQGAVEYLSQMGIMDLESFKDLDFVVGVATGKCIQTHCGEPMAVYNQALIEGGELAATSSSAEPTM